MTLLTQKARQPRGCPPPRLLQSILRPQAEGPWSPTPFLLDLKSLNTKGFVQKVIEPRSSWEVALWERPTNYIPAAHLTYIQNLLRTD